jgi:hypothetical protein
LCNGLERPPARDQPDTLRVVASVWVRYADGDEATWHLTDELAVDLHKFVADIGHAGFAGNLFSFPVMPEEGNAGTDYGFVSLRMANVVTWRVDGLVNAAAAAALWAELQPPSD